MTLKNARAPLLSYFKLCVSFHTHWWIQTSYSPKTPNLGQNRRFCSRVSLKLDRWPCKTTGHLFYATSSFVHHFVPIAVFKLELQSGNGQSGSKSTIFLAVWPSNLTDDLHLLYDTLSFVHHFNDIGKFKLKSKSGNAQFGSKSTIFLAVWPKNFTDDPEKQ